MRAPRRSRWVAGVVSPVALLALVPLLPAAPAAGSHLPVGTTTTTTTTAATTSATSPATSTASSTGTTSTTTGAAGTSIASRRTSVDALLTATPNLLTTAPRWPLAAACTTADATSTGLPGQTSTGTSERALHAPPGDRFSPISSLGPHLRLRRAYAVRAGRLEPVDGLDHVRACDADLWRVVLTATPAPVRSHLAELVVFDGPDDSPEGQLLGDVEPAGDDPGSWRLALRLDAGDDHQLLLTIAHEVAHLVSLGTGQMDRSHTGRDCPTYLTVTGCLRQGSLLLGFLDATWTTGLFREWVRADEQPTEAARLTALRTFYARHRTAFVSPYAATSPEEDFAESWASWCVDGAGATREGRARTDWVRRALAAERDVASGCAVLHGLSARG